MKNLTLIACISKDGGLGKSGQLLWHIPEDMRFFRQTTTGHPVVMGGATYRSIGHPLPKRQNIVLSRRPIDDEGVLSFTASSDLEKFLSQQSDEVFIIGGASLYQMFINQADRIYLTEVDDSRPADVFFPDFDRKKYQKTILYSGEHDGVKYQIIEYTKE